jgi:LmbE family N-acetylglucosaminyl deacetylase
MRRISRRGFGKGALLLGVEAATVPAARAAAATRLKVVCVGAHPDDPESGAGGTIARYAAAGHRVTIVYLTRGEAGIAGRPARAAAAIRTAEAEAACRLLGAKPVFFGQIDGATSYTPEAVGAMERILRAEAPDVLLAHWPIDTHMDHQVAGMLALQGLRAAGLTTPLFHYEVMTGEQTLSFRPTHYVDVTPTREKKRAALLLHRSQPVAAVYRDHHAPMEVFRGREAGVAAAEAFCAVARAGGGGLPGLG